MSDPQATRRRPARWRSVPTRVFGHLKGYTFELRRGERVLARVAESSKSTQFSRQYYWTSALGPTRNSLLVREPFKRIDDAKSAAKSYATQHEEWTS